MDYRKLGNTGIDVSPLCLGCMSFGAPDQGNHPWTLDEETSRPFLRRAIEAGINFFDTANVSTRTTVVLSTPFEARPPRLDPPAAD